MPHQWTPLRDYAGYQHVLFAIPCFVHPISGNIYYAACEQKAGKQQNLAIYRELGHTGEWQHVVTFAGTVDAQAFITPGGCVIGQGGALVVATSLQPIGVPFVTTTGYQGVRCKIPGVDLPWGPWQEEARLVALEARLAAIEALLGTPGGLGAKEKEALGRLVEMLRL